MSANDILTKQDDIDVAGLMSSLKRNLWLIVLVTVLTGVVLFFVLLTVSPRYLSSAEVLIASKASSAVQQIQEGNNRQVDNRVDERAVRTEVEVLGSDKIALEVIDELGLVSIKEFQESSSITDDLTGYIADATIGRPQNAENSDLVKNITPEDVERSTALRIFRSKLKIYAIENSQVITIEFWSKNPALARNVVAEITKRYQSSQLDATREKNELAAGFVNPRILELRSLIEKEKNAAAKFESDNGIFRTNNGTADGPGLLVNQELSEASSELSRLRAQRSAAQARIASIRAALNSGAEVDAISEVMQSGYIQNLRQSEVALKAQISELSTSLLPQHPRMKAMNSQLERYKSQIRKATQDVITSLENNVAATRTAERKLSEEIDKLKQDQLDVNNLMVKLDGYKKNISAYEEELQQRLADSQQVRSRADIPPEGADIISPASIPDEPYFPKVVPFTLAGMTAAAVLSILGVLAVNLVTTVSAHHVSNARANRPDEPYLDQETAHSSADLDEPHGLETQKQPVTVAANPVSRQSLKELEKTIMSNLRKATLGDGSDLSNAGNDAVIAVRYAASVLSDMRQGRIAVVSPAGDAGSKTTTILARLLSKSGHKVVVIDLSGGLASTMEMLNTTDVPGIFNLVSGSTTVDNAIYADHASGVHIISAGELFPGTPTPDPEVIGQTVDAIADVYDFCIVDCGDADIEGVELVSTDDAVVVISAIDAEAKDCDDLEQRFKAEGFRDVLQIVPDNQDEEKEALAIA